MRPTKSPHLRFPFPLHPRPQLQHKRRRIEPPCCKIERESGRVVCYAGSSTGRFGARSSYCWLLVAPSLFFLCTPGNLFWFMLFAFKNCVFNYFFILSQSPIHGNRQLIAYGFLLLAERAMLLSLVRRGIINLIGDLDCILFISGHTYRPRSDLPT